MFKLEQYTVFYRSRRRDHLFQSDVRVDKTDESEGAHHSGEGPPP